MMFLNKGFYTRPGTPDIIIEVVKIGYRGEGYVKAHIRLIGARDGGLFETIRGAKLFYKNISHWKKITRGL
jgi:hypothetical protein